MERIGPYTIVRELGRGGMGVVYVARDARLGREVALKVLAGAAAGEARERFLREGRAAAQLRHPNVVAVHEVGEERGVLYLAMELIAGETLHARVARAGPLDAALAARLTRDLAHALHEAHERGIVHRDVKPANVLLSEGDGRPLLMDFGVARDLLRDAPLTATGDVLGTPEFMAPEQADGQSKRAGGAADIYALGATLYFALTGRPPFVGQSLANVLAQVLQRAPAPPSALRPGSSPGLDAVVLRALAKTPAERQASAAQLASELDAALAAPAVRATRRPALVVALSGVAAVTGVGVVALALRPSPPPPPPAIATSGPPPAIEPAVTPSTGSEPPVGSDSAPAGYVWREVTIGPPGHVGRAHLENAAVHHPGLGEVLCFGGSTFVEDQRFEHADLWAFGGQRWERRAAPTADLARLGPSLAFDAERQQVVLFGGYAGGRHLGDTWVWDRAEGWRPARGGAGGGPAPRSFASLVWAPDRRVALLYGGYGGADGRTDLGDLWAWDGSRWRQQRVEPAPPARRHGLVTYDTTRGRLLLYGGSGERDDLWEWDGRWHARAREGAPPPPLAKVPMIHDGARAIVVALGCTWAWDGGRWERLDVGPTGPEPRHDHALVWDASRRVAVLFGGRAVDDAKRALSDTWELVPR